LWQWPFLSQNEYQELYLFECLLVLLNFADHFIISSIQHPRTTTHNMLKGHTARFSAKPTTQPTLEGYLVLAEYLAVNLGEDHIPSPFPFVFCFLSGDFC